MILRKPQPMRQHQSMRFWQRFESDRILHHSEERVQDASRSRFRRLIGSPFEHIGMDGCITRRKPQTCDTSTVFNHRKRAIRRTYHVAEFPYARANVRLAKFDKDIWLDCLQPHHNIREQPLDGQRYALDVTSCVPILYGRIRTLQSEAPYEIKFKSVKIPFANSLFVGADQEFTHFWESWVKNPSASTTVLSRENLAPETCKIGALLAYERHGIPEHVLKTKCMHPLHMRCHV